MADGGHIGFIKKMQDITNQLSLVQPIFILILKWVHVCFM